MKKNVWMILVLCLCVLVVSSIGVQAVEPDTIANDESGIPDEILYKEVLKTLGKKPDETFTKQEAESVGKLDIREQVVTLKGIGALSHLEELRIEGSMLTSLEGLEGNSRLTVLSVPHNEISSLAPLKELVNLRDLDVSFNYVDNLKDIENLENLESLAAAGNQLRNVKPLENLRNLRNLQLNDNNLKSLNGIQKLTNLVQLHVRGNKLTGANEIKNLKKLKDLDLGYNKLKQIPNIKSFQKLSYHKCKLDNNRFTERELRKRLPERFFAKGKGKERWQKEQIQLQNLSYKIKLIKPTKNMVVAKSTKRIVGRTIKEAYVELEGQSKEFRTKRVQADEKGLFVLDHLNLKEWPGKKARFHIYVRIVGSKKLQYISSENWVKIKG